MAAKKNDPTTVSAQTPVSPEASPSEEATGIIDMAALAALDLGLDEDTLGVIMDTPAANMREKHPLLNSEIYATESKDSNESIGHVMRLLMWHPPFASKKGGKDTVWEKFDLQMVEPDTSKGATAVAGEKFSILCRRGSETDDKKANAIRGGIMAGVAASVLGQKSVTADEAKKTFKSVHAGLKTKQLPENIAERCLCRVHVGYDRNYKKSSNAVTLHPTVQEKFGGRDVVAVKPGQPKMGQYGTYFFHCRVGQVG